MFKAIFILFLATHIYANTVVDIYLEKGISGVEKYILSALESKSYWEEKLKSTDVSLGYYENLGTLLVASKKKKRLQVYNNTQSGLELVTSYDDVIVGKEGDKKVEGDLKTPVGVYDITRRFVPNDLFYGPLAYALSYPNTMDKVHKKNGYGIWIHGSPMDGSERDPMSKGCIVMDNDTIMLMDTKVKAKNAMTIIGEDEVEKANLDTISTILANLYRWKRVWSDNNLQEYLSFYDEDFRRFDGMRISKFKEMKTYIFKYDDEKEIDITNINIAPYPNLEKKNIFKISFDEDYKSKKHSFRGSKELYIKLDGDKFSILVEK
jgi:murein L,D-transpeptidase YafK